MTCSASSAANRIQSMMATLKVDEDTPIAAKMLSNTIEGAQAKVEGRNFAIRKNVLQFDDVANRQREVIYKQRQQVLDGADISAVISRMIDEIVGETVDRFIRHQRRLPRLEPRRPAGLLPRLGHHRR